jgi:hypothetical protein
VCANAPEGEHTGPASGGNPTPPEGGQQPPTPQPAPEQ